MIQVFPVRHIYSQGWGTQQQGDLTPADLRREAGAVNTHKDWDNDAMSPYLV